MQLRAVHPFFLWNVVPNECLLLTGRGLADLENQLISTPIDPRATFLDDPLRILRGVRFATVLNFKLDQEIIKAAQDPEVRAALAKKVTYCW